MCILCSMFSIIIVCMFVVSVLFSFDSLATTCLKFSLLLYRFIAASFYQCLFIFVIFVFRQLMGIHHGFPAGNWTPQDYCPWEIFPPWDYFPWESHKKIPMGFPVENGHHGIISHGKYSHHGIISHGNPIKNSHGFPGRKWTPWDYFPWESHKKFPWDSRQKMDTMGLSPMGVPIKNSHGIPGRKWTPWDYLPWEQTHGR